MKLFLIKKSFWKKNFQDQKARLVDKDKKRNNNRKKEERQMDRQRERKREGQAYARPFTQLVNGGQH